MILDPPANYFQAVTVLDDAGNVEPGYHVNAAPNAFDPTHRLAALAPSDLSAFEVFPTTPDVTWGPGTRFYLFADEATARAHIPAVYWSGDAPAA